MCTALFDLHQITAGAGLIETARMIWAPIAALCGDF